MHSCRKSVSLDDCQQLCVRYGSRCLTLQYDFYRDNCEVYDVPSPLRVNASGAVFWRRKRSISEAGAAKNDGCVLASLSPTIGTTHMIPSLECLRQNSPQNSEAPRSSEPQSQTQGPQPIKQPPLDLKIRKVKDDSDKYTVVSNTKGTGEDKNPKIRLTRPTNDQEMLSLDPISNFAVEVLPIVPDCPVGEHARIQLIEGVQVDTNPTLMFKVEAPEQCVQSCRTSTVGGAAEVSFLDGSRLPLLCRSAQFDRKSNTCYAFHDAIDPNGYLDYKPNADILYIEKICIPDVVLPLSCDDVFRRIPQHIILGHASEILSVSSEQECVLQCIRSKSIRKTECHSVLHYPDFAAYNCILNVHTRHTKSAYFMPERTLKVDYVELAACASQLSFPQGHAMTSHISHAPMNPFERNDEKPDIGAGSTISEWTEWTSCDDETSTRSRQRLCDGCKEIIQFLPCFSNNNFDLALQKFINEQKRDSEKGNEGIEHPVIAFPSKDEERPEQVEKKSVEFFGPPMNQLSPHQPHMLSSY
ncbi:unnamed protein product [Caenorhabditis auriculariae]|uniref:Apple domain-containing protein n=1 Tax=Caenorhabditis auriculariae TaxID=2777116 RepID=A0A8S1GPK7_9PELO|nr:unnamed protein product [Caenorhabditis auriculariae]